MQPWHQGVRICMVVWHKGGNRTYSHSFIYPVSTYYVPTQQGAKGRAGPCPVQLTAHLPMSKQSHSVRT